MDCYNSSCATPTVGSAPQTFAAALQFFAALQCHISEGIIPQANVKNNEKFDFIIIGAGSAGCVVANRLSEVPEWNVLLIEAGDDPPMEADVPALDKSLFGTKYDWKYKTADNGRTNKGYVNGSINWPRGKTIGGSSNFNAMIYIRGNDHDYQSWHDEGNFNWSVKDVKRCFRKAESMQDTRLPEDVQKLYGKEGSLVINTCNSTYRDLTEKVLASWAEIGIPDVPDLNFANVLGSGITRTTAANGERQSSNKAYLNPILNRKNMKILKNALVTKILIHSYPKLAYGVEVELDNHKMKFYTKKEVILSAGTINSPQLLMLSGVGPKEHIQSKRVPCKVDSPMVGQNLQDHSIVPIIICGDEPGEENIAEKHFQEIEYLYNRTGYLAQISIADILAFFSKDKNSSYPDYQSFLMITPKNTTSFQRSLTELGLKQSVIDPLVELNKNYSVYRFLFTLLHPYSRGNISLYSNNPKDAPIIHPNYFGSPKDLESAVTGIEILASVVNTTYFKSIKGFLARIKWPACDSLELGSREYWNCICLNFVRTVYHPAGTCKMGPDVRTSVVDDRLKVHGVRDLRVIDASIMPTIISGNLSGPVTMIAERGSELIKEEYNKG